MSDRLVRIEAGPLVFAGALERETAPRNVDHVLSLLPLQSTILQARWSGFAAWVPLDEATIDVPPENATAYPQPGQLLLYPGGVSPPEILVPYGATAFTSVAGPLAGNHFLTIVEGADRLPELGRLVQWEGAQPVSFALA
ncbi:MAG: DUF3830 family protein [Actinobacteria bacterium]|nr:DUF3830 family protein [Actinomycetota bacterium]